LTDDARLELDYSHSQKIDYQNSSVTISFNRQPVASLSLSEETAGTGYERILLAGTNILDGDYNRLSVEVDMTPLFGERCVNPNTRDAWFLIRDTSKVRLAHNENTDAELDLRRFPLPFHLNTTMSDLLFVLPEVPTSDEVDAALQLSASLGDSASGRMLIPDVALGNNVSSEVLAERHVIAIGLPADHGLIQDINDSLPLAFMPGENRPLQVLDDVVLRWPEDMDIAYLQLLPSPWNEDFATLVVAGTSDEAIHNVTQILVRTPWQLGSGNLTFVTEDNIKTIDTREILKKNLPEVISTVVETSTTSPVETVTTTPLAAVTAISEAGASDESEGLQPAEVSASAQSTVGETLQPQPGWLLPLILAVGLIILSIFVVAFLQFRR
jgi:hypothetical protein